MKSTNIRNVVSADITKLKEIIDATEMFPSEMLDDMIAGFLNGKDESIWLTYDDGQARAVAYCAPEQMTEGSWNLYLIAVEPEQQSKGIGRSIMQHIENLLASSGQRILLVETSGLPEFERTRAFYHQCNYTEAARIPEFYTAGEDKVVFWKKLG